MKEILIISSNRKITDIIQKDVDNLFSCSCCDATQGIEQISSNRFDVVLLLADLPGGIDASLAARAVQRTDAAVVVLTDKNQCTEFEKVACDYGVVVLTRPILKSELYTVIKTCAILRNRYRPLCQENARLSQQMTQMKMVNRAKAVLMRTLAMTEDQAHHYIEKQAMDLHISKTEAAIRVLRTYDYSN